VNIVVMASTPGLQAVLAGEMDFTGSGSSALVAVPQSNALLKTVLAVNDQVLQCFSFEILSRFTRRWARK